MQGRMQGPCDPELSPFRFNSFSFEGIAPDVRYALVRGLVCDVDHGEVALDLAARAAGPEREKANLSLRVWQMWTGAGSVVSYNGE